MFRTKRQKRESRLLKLTDQQWATLPEFLILFDNHFSTGLNGTGSLILLNKETLPSRSAEAEFRVGAIRAYLKAAAEKPAFAEKLDRYLGLRTDDEDREYHEYWATKRNKAYYLFAMLAFLISLISLLVSLWR